MTKISQPTTSLDDNGLAIDRISRFVNALDGYLRRTAAADPHDPRLEGLTRALDNARTLLNLAVGSAVPG